MNFAFLSSVIFWIFPRYRSCAFTSSRCPRPFGGQHWYIVTVAHLLRPCPGSGLDPCTGYTSTSPTSRCTRLGMSRSVQSVVPWNTMLPMSGRLTTSSHTCFRSLAASFATSGTMVSPCAFAGSCASGFWASSGSAGFWGWWCAAAPTSEPLHERILSTQVPMARHHTARGTAVEHTPRTNSSLKSGEESSFRSRRYCASVTSSGLILRSRSGRLAWSVFRTVDSWVSGAPRTMAVASRTLLMTLGGFLKPLSSRRCFGERAWTHDRIVPRQRSSSAWASGLQGAVLVVHESREERQLSRGCVSDAGVTVRGEALLPAAGAAELSGCPTSSASAARQRSAPAPPLSVAGSPPATCSGSAVGAPTTGPTSCGSFLGAVVWCSFFACCGFSGMPASASCGSFLGAAAWCSFFACCGFSGMPVPSVSTELLRTSWPWCSSGAPGGWCLGAQACAPPCAAAARAPSPCGWSAGGQALKAKDAGPAWALYACSLGVARGSAADDSHVLGEGHLLRASVRPGAASRHDRACWAEGWCWSPSVCCAAGAPLAWCSARSCCARESPARPLSRPSRQVPCGVGIPYFGAIDSRSGADTRIRHGGVILPDGHDGWTTATAVPSRDCCGDGRRLGDTRPLTSDVCAASAENPADTRELLGADCCREVLIRSLGDSTSGGIWGCAQVADGREYGDVLRGRALPLASRWPPMAELGKAFWHV
mmetsp:Transcript_103188/g.292332  ORF Transcript_103188/g.292332 Transcript_103188/m.292332 type:complete len:709 (+) Transcript_103188:285-2411(+)